MVRQSPEEVQKLLEAKAARASAQAETKPRHYHGDESHEHAWAEGDAHVHAWQRVDVKKYAARATQ